SAFSADDLVRSVAAANAGRLGRALSDIEQAAVRFEASRSLVGVADLLAAINRAGGVRCYRPAVLAAAQRALQLAASAGGLPFRDAAVTIREQSRLIGRPLARRSVGSTLLLKGLEADISVVLNAGTLNARNLYVAMTRGSRRVLVCTPAPILNPSW
ncbi:MAG: DNA helicase UvrD, partial [Rhodospirillales bacterium]|nr:DNA helicase UvrD [Rhodospirillales bacterium]